MAVVQPDSNLWCTHQAFHIRPIAVCCLANFQYLFICIINETKTTENWQPHCNQIGTKTEQSQTGMNLELADLHVFFHCMHSIYVYTVVL